MEAPAHEHLLDGDVMETSAQVDEDTGPIGEIIHYLD